jgi:predicted nucleic acid-binding protein
VDVQLDTNVLTRLAQPSHPMHAAALAALRNLLSAAHVPCIVPQNLFEFWAVATRRIEDNGLGLSVAEAKAEVDKLKNAFALFLDSPLLLDEWERLVVAHECKGKGSHDARIVAAMNIHGTKQLLTFNVKDFVRYAGVTVLDAATYGNMSSPPTGP